MVEDSKIWSSWVRACPGNQPLGTQKLKVRAVGSSGAHVEWVVNNAVKGRRDEYLASTLRMHLRKVSFKESLLKLFFYFLLLNVTTGKKCMCPLCAVSPGVGRYGL